MEATNYSYPGPEPVEQESHKSFKIYIIIGSIVLALFLLWSAGYLDKKEHQPITYEEVLQVSNDNLDPVPLQNYFVEQVAAGVNDDKTRSAIYWITHRYFDNGGNIYEISDFIEAHPEISFLKEAELIYPEQFQKIREKKVPKTYSFDSLYAMLAYYEVIDKNNYGDIAIWGLAANKYAELTLWSIPEDETKIDEEYLKSYRQLRSRSEYFIERINNFINKNTQETNTLADLNNLKTVPTDDLLVGLNQYASALLILKGTGNEARSNFSPFQIFEFNSEYAKANVPRLYLFTNYLFATSLAYSGNTSKAEVAIPLDRVVAYVRENQNQGPATINRILSSKVNTERGVFDYDVTQILAAAHPGFKGWLLDSGWTEADFQK